MKSILIFLIGLIVQRDFILAGIDTDIAEANSVILPSGRWTPSVDEARKALSAIQSFLETTISTNDRNKSEIKKILDHSKEYRVQFIGVIHDEKRLILCNFFPARRNKEKDGFEYWKRQEVSVDDGGFWYWQIEYDTSTGKCVNFASNGEA